MTDLAPAAFLGHGNPMNTLEHNSYTEAWRRFGEACGHPSAVLSISAHWFTDGCATTAMGHPSTIHDFYGFPRELYEFSYPAPGLEDLAHEVAWLAGPHPVKLDYESWGLDHGTWSVLAHAFPEADVPVVQLSIDALQPLSYHVDLGRRLAPLREQGVVIVGSGNVVHNLGLVDWSEPDGAFGWAQRFGSRAREVMLAAPEQALTLAEDPDYRISAPTPEHFIPLLYIAALAEVAEKPATLLVDGYAYGSVSMAAYGLDVPEA